LNRSFHISRSDPVYTLYGTNKTLESTPGNPQGDDDPEDVILAANDDDEDGKYDEDPGGFDNKWDHIMMIRDYEWFDYTQEGNEQYIKTLGHRYDYIHSHGPSGSGKVEEHDQFHYKIRYADDWTWDPRRLVWNIIFKRPKRP